MPTTITIDNKELALSPLSFEDMEAIEREARAEAQAKAELQIARMDRLRIGDEQDRKALLDAASDEGAAELDFVRGFVGRSYVLWLSVRKVAPTMTLEEFRKQCPATNHRKAEALIAEVMGPSQVSESKPLPPHEHWKAVEEQDELRTRIFNALCEGEGITPDELKAMEICNVVPLWCKYSNTNKCDPEKLRDRIEEYCQLKKKDEEDGAAGAPVSNPTQPNTPLIQAA
jgi:hypothetical protein